MSHPNTLRITRWALSVLATAFVVIVFFWSLPQSAVVPPRQTKIGMMCLLPQGWSFFTRDPREPRVEAFRLVEGAWQPALLRGTSAANAFGIARLSRVQGAEFAGLTQQIPDDAWTSQDDPFADATQRESIPEVVVHNRGQRPTLDGELLVRRAAPVPWAWSRSYHDVKMPSEYVRLRVLPASPRTSPADESLALHTRPTSANEEDER